MAPPRFCVPLTVTSSLDRAAIAQVVHGRGTNATDAGQVVAAGEGTVAASVTHDGKKNQL